MLAIPVIVIVAAAAIVLLTAGIGSAQATCTIYWTGATSSDWFDGTNWSLTDGGPAANATPSSTDFVCMSSAPTTASVTLGSSSADVGGIDWRVNGAVHPQLTLQNQLQVDTTGSSTIASVDLQGTLVAAGAVTVPALTFDGGTLDGPAAVTVPSAGTLKVGGGNTSYGVLAGGADLVNMGAGSETSNGSTLYFSGTSKFENAGTLSLRDSGGLVDQDCANPSQFVNDSGATLSYGGSTSSSASQVGVAFDNKGTISVTKGTLGTSNCGNSSKNEASLAVSLGATLQLSGLVEFSTGATESGAGAAQVDGTTTVDGSNSFANLDLTGTLVASGTASVSGFTFDGGTLDGPAAVTVPPAGALKVGGGSHTYGFLAGGADLINMGTGTETSNGSTLYFSVTSKLENAGTLSLRDSGGFSDQDCGNPSQFVNDSGATLSYGGSTSGSSSQEGVGFDNKGTISVTKGTLGTANCGNSSTNEASLAVSLGATLQLSSQVEFSTGATESGAGTVQVTSTTTTDGSNSFANLDLTGTLVANGTASVSAFTFDGGTLDGPAAVTVPAAGTLKIGGSNTVYGTLAGSADLINKGAGTETSSGSTLYFSGKSKFENAGTLSLADNTNIQTGGLYDQDCANPSQFVNDSGATLSYGGSTSGSTSHEGVAFDNQGTISVTKGTLDGPTCGNSPSTNEASLSVSLGGTLELSGPVEFSTGATESGAGTALVDGTTTVDGSNSFANLDLTGTLVANGTASVSAFTFDGGTLDGPAAVTVPSAGTLKVGGGSSINGSLAGGADLINMGAGSESSNGSTLFFSGTSKFENAGTLSLRDSGGLSDQDCGNPSQFVNDSGATLSYGGSTSSSTSHEGVAFDNKGTINVTNGTLGTSNCGNSSKNEASLTVSAGATLQLASQVEFTTGATESGAGTAQVTDTTTVDGSNSIANLDLAGTLVANGTASVSAFTFDGGTLDGPAAVTVPPTGALAVGASSNSGGHLASGADLINKGTGTETGGSDLTFSGASKFENAGTLSLADNGGTDDFDCANPSHLTNDVGATLSYGGSSTSSTAHIGAGFLDNKGTLSVTQGTLVTNNCGAATTTNESSFSIASGAVLSMQGQGAFGSGAQSTGAGTLQIANNVTAAGSNTLSNVDLLATLTASGAVSVPALTFNGGTLDGPGVVTVPATGTLTIGGSSSVDGFLASGADLINKGTGTEHSAFSTLLVSGSSKFENAGSLSLADNGGVSNNGDVSSQFVNDGAASVSYAGTSGSQTSTVNVAFNNQGTVKATLGTLALSGLTNLNSGVLNGGTYNASGGTIQLPADVTKNSAIVTLGASPSAIVDGSSANALATLTSNTGSLDLKQSLGLGGALSTSGTLAVEKGTLKATPFTQTAGTTTVVGGATGGTLQSGGGAGNVTINGGTLTGTGQIKGNVLGTGTVQPIGAVAGPMTGSGTYNVSSGTLSIPISGATTAGTDFGQFSLTGAATLGGTLALSTANGFSPAFNTQLTLLNAGSVAGTFGTVTGLTLSDRRWIVTYNSTSVFATAEPPTPTVTAVSPTAGPLAGGTTVTITGTNFVNSPSVSFGGTVATNVNVISPTQVTATAPAETAGTVDVTVNNCQTVSDSQCTSPTSAADRYTYDAPPTVAGVNPSAGPTAGGTAVTITGTNFVSGSTTVSFGGSPASNVSVASGTQLKATAPAGSPGAIDVTVTTPGGTSATSSADQFTYDPPPTVTSISPTAGPTAGGTSVTINGTGFVNGSSVKFGANPGGSVTFVSSTKLTATAPAGSAGTIDVTVTTPGGTTPASSADQFTYDAPPTVTGVSPAAGPAAGGSTVTVTGTNLTSDAAVKFGSAAGTSVNVASSTQLTATAPAGTGVVDVTVVTPGGTSATSSADQYTYGPPTVSSVSPNQGPTAGGNSVTVTGAGFVPGATVSFGANAGTSVSVSSGTQLTVNAPSGAAGTVDVTVTTSGGTSATGASDQYAYDAVPTVANVNPSAGPTAGGTKITVTGTGFVNGSTSVSVAGNPATSVNVGSSTSLTATTPAGTAGTADVTVTTPGGTSATSPGDRFTYEVVPTVTSVGPNAGPTAGGNTVTIKGTGFTSDATVKFGSQVSGTVQFVSSTELTAAAPAAGAGTVDMTVTTPGGTSPTSSADQYTYTAAPTVTGVSPTGGAVAGGNTVTVTGTGFASGASVSFGGNAASSVNVVSATQLTAQAPAGSAGTVDVTVTTAGGTSATSTADQYTYGSPTVTAVNPLAGPTSGGTSVSITGTGFVPGATVAFGSTAASSVTFVSSTQLKATSPAESAGTVDVTVTTPGGTSAASAADQFTYGPPTISGLSPNAGPVAGGNTVTITGSRFVPGATVKFGSNAATSVTVVSTTQISATAPAGAAGTVDVTVSTAGGTSAISPNDAYAYGAPSVSSLSPNAGPAGGGNTVTINGKGFVPGATVQFGAQPGTSVTFVSGTKLTAVAPAGANHSTVDVRVTTSAGTSASNPGPDSYAYGSSVVNNVGANAGPIAGGNTINVNGNGFVPGASVKFGTTNASSVTFVNPGQLKVVAPAHAAGTIDVTVTTPAGTSATTPVDNYAYGAPTVTAVIPNAGATGGGNTVKITGTSLVPGTTVRFGSTSAVSPTYVGSGPSAFLTVPAPAGSAGTVDVTVTTSAGASASSAADKYAYGLPKVTAVSPQAGSIAGGNTVTITGSGFVPGATVKIGSNQSSLVAVDSGTQLRAKVPAAAAGSVHVSVQTAAGSSASTSADLYAYDPVPTVGAANPSAGPTAGSNTVTITGTGFVSGATVKFGSTAAKSMTFVSSTQVKAVAPAHAAGKVDVTITTPGGTSATGSGDVYTFDAPPTITKLTKNAGPTAGGNSVVVTGTNFTSAATAKFGTTAASSVTFNSSTQLTVVAPAGSARTVYIKVTTPGGITPDANGAFYAYGKPDVTGIAPNAGPVAGTNTVAISGHQFVPGVTVKFGAKAASTVTFVSPTKITAVVPAASAAGVVNVQVTNAAGASTTGGLAQQYAYGPPTVSGLTPATGPAGSFVTVTGTNFVQGATASLVASSGTKTASASVLSSTQVRVLIPNGYTAPAKIKITTPAGSATSAGQFTPDLAITKFSPATGPVGTSVTIAGIGFNATSKVSFNGKASTGVTHVSATQLKATVPTGATSGPITVTNSSGPVGQTQSASTFTVT